MLTVLKNIFKQTTEESYDESNEDLNLLCGLMMEAAQIDGTIDQQEVNKISKVLIDIFKEDPLKVEIALHQSLAEVNQHKSLHSFTSKINKTFSDEKKLLLLEILWEIILEDGKVHDFESNLVRRLSGLLYISDVSCGIVKKRALDKLTKL